MVDVGKEGFSSEEGEDDRDVVVLEVCSEDPDAEREESWIADLLL